MNISMLLISGYHSVGQLEIPLSHYGSLYHLFFHDKVDFKTCSVKTHIELSNYVASYALEEFEIVYLVYVGHGIGQHAVEYPFVDPGLEPIDITKASLRNRHGKDIRFRCILDCFNVHEVELSQEVPVPAKEFSSHIDNFLALDFAYICLRKGLMGFTFENRTHFNDALFDVILNYTYTTITDFLQILNYAVGERYKVGTYKRVKKTHINKFISSSPDFKVIAEQHAKAKRIDEPIKLEEEFGTYSMDMAPMEYEDFHAENRDACTVFGMAIDTFKI